jgi:hypothetical protein
MIGLAALFAAPRMLRADSLPPAPSGQAAPNGYWSFANGVGSSNSLPLMFSGSGSMDIGMVPSPNSPMVFVDLAWQPNEFTLGPGTGPVTVTWTALSAGDFMVMASAAPTQGVGASSFAQAADFGKPAGQPGFFRENMSFKPGDSICFELPSANPNSDFVFFGRTSVPEPSRPVALAGIVGSMFCIAAFFGLRRKRR